MNRISPVRNIVHRLRIESGVTQQQVADLVCVSRQTVVAIEGCKSSVSLELAFRIAHVFRFRSNMSSNIENRYMRAPGEIRVTLGMSPAADGREMPLRSTGLTEAERLVQASFRKCRVSLKSDSLRQTETQINESLGTSSSGLDA